MVHPNLKRIAPLFFAVMTGCTTVSYQDRVGYEGCTRIVYNDKKEDDTVVYSKFVSSKFDKVCHDKTMDLETKKHNNALEAANNNSRLRRENIQAQVDIETQRDNQKLSVKIFKEIATMEIKNPILDKKRRNRLVDGIVQHIENQATQLEQQGATDKDRIYHEVSELFEMYDTAKSHSEIKNPVVRDTFLQRAINEIVIRYNGGKNALDMNTYRQKIDEQLVTRGVTITNLENQFKPSVTIKKNTDGDFTIFGLKLNL